MGLYKILVSCKKSGLYEASCDAFNVPSVSASTPGSAVKALKDFIEREGARLMSLGEAIPAESDIKDGEYIIDCDIMKKFTESSPELVRRTISLPKWMDILIRNSEIDSSGLFREAVMDRLQIKDDPITSVDELRFKVSDSVLKEYLKQTLAKIEEEL